MGIDDIPILHLELDARLGRDENSYTFTTYLGRRVLREKALSIELKLEGTCTEHTKLVPSNGPQMDQRYSPGSFPNFF